MWIGVLLVALSAVVGGRVLAASDDTVELWAAARDLPVGAAISAGDLVSTSVHFGGGGAVNQYVPAVAGLVGERLAQPVAAGQLIPSSAIEAAARPMSEVPIGVAAADLPADLSAGDRVDVWARPDDARSGGGAAAIRVLRDVRVAAVTAPEIAAAGGDREVLLAVDSSDQVESVLDALIGTAPVLVRVGG
jgi:hypothetical protein